MWHAKNVVFLVLGLLLVHIVVVVVIIMFFHPGPPLHHPPPMCSTPLPTTDSLTHTSSQLPRERFSSMKSGTELKQGLHERWGVDVCQTERGR